MPPEASVCAERSTRRRIGVGLCALALLLAGCGDGGALDGLPQGREGVVTRVLSGEVIELDGKEQVRLAGIAAPVGDAPYALAAQQVLDKLVRGPPGGAVLRRRARKDRLERTLAQVQDADSRRWIEGAMLDAGAARCAHLAGRPCAHKADAAARSGGAAGRAGVVDHPALRRALAG